MSTRRVAGGRCELGVGVLVRGALALVVVVAASALAGCGDGATAGESQEAPARDDPGAALERIVETLDEISEAAVTSELVESARAYIGVAEQQPIVTGDAGGLDLGESKRHRSPDLDPAMIAEPVRRYAPLVHLHPSEWLFPLDSALFLAHSTLMWAHADCAATGVARGVESDGDADLPLLEAEKLGGGGYSSHAGCAANGPVFTSDQLTRPADRQPERPAGLASTEGFFLELDDPYRAGDPAARANGRAAGLPVYFEYEPGRYITYWFLYGGSASPLPTPTLDPRLTILAHEGDWERISVRLDASDRATAVAYFAHRGNLELPWEEIETFDETHPVVYAAWGTHASYPSPGVRRLDCPLEGLCLYDFAETSQGPWETWTNLRAARDEPWYGFGGAWGTNWPGKNLAGALGPSRYRIAAPERW